MRELKFPESNWMRKGSEEKVRIAARLRGETSVPLDSVARELKLGSVAYVAERLLDCKEK